MNGFVSLNSSKLAVFCPIFSKFILYYNAVTFFEYLFSLDHIRDRHTSNRPQCLEKFSDIKYSQMGEIAFKFSAMVGEIFKY